MKSLIGLNDFADVIESLKKSKRKGSAKYTYNQLAQLLGYKSPRTLAMVHNGQRTPSANLIKKISERMALTAKEKEYLHILAEKSVAKKKHLNTFEPNEKLKKLSTRSTYIELNEADLQAFSHYLFLTVKQIIQSSAEGVTLQEIQSKLSEPIKLDQITLLTDHLERLHFCAKEKDGRLRKLSDKYITTTSQIPSVAIRNFHRQNIERTTRALEMPIEKREFMTSALSVKKSEIVIMKKRMQEFLFEMLDEYGHPETGEAIVQLNLQLFEQALIK
ncbi:MAG: TIGR02147 family protein [Bdellovibrionaceae bacterium]|nr:TIGR02147 family protein [Pseudobdellovibrionaceae bacterium]